MVGSVLARKCFVCIEQEKQRRAEDVNELCRLKYQARICPAKGSLSWTTEGVLPLVSRIQFASKLCLGNTTFSRDGCRVYGINPKEIQNLISVQFYICESESVD